MINNTVIIVTALFFLIGCSHTNSKDIKIVPMNNKSAMHEGSTAVFSQTRSTNLKVKEFVRGNDVFIECVISNFTFAKRADHAINKKGFGFLRVYLNGDKIDDIYTAAFIMKDLPVGNHDIKLVLVQNDGTPYGVSEKFKVKIS